MPNPGANVQSNRVFFLLLWISVLLQVRHSSAQTTSIPSPSEFHAFDISSKYIITAALYDYYREVARLSPRVEYTEYGRSIQGRPLPMLLVSSRANLAAKESIRERIRSLTLRTDPLTEGDLSNLTSETPAIVWIFIVDTDEEAGVQVLQEVVYDLAIREDAEARAIRDNLLVILTPLTNPDSHARYVTWHGLYDVDGASIDQNAIENSAHWGMNTDGNAFGIDVNRDFGWFVSPEMQALARSAVHWRPQLWLDIHSGPNVIFLPPFPRPFHPLWPDEAPKWWQAVAREAGERFGSKGWSFNTRQGYEGVTHVGFGLSWGMLGPSVAGFLFETFGGRPGKTTAFQRSDGSIATMRMAMDRHALGTWSLLRVAAQRRQELLRDAHDVIIKAVQQARSNPVRSVIIPTGGPDIDPDKVQRLIDRLLLQGVEVRRASARFRATVRDFLHLEKSVQRDFTRGDYIVDFVQPQARLARTLLDPTLDYSDPLVEVPYGRKMPYYDVSWGNLTHLFGVQAFASGKTPAVDTDVALPVRPEGGVLALNGAEPPYAYLLPAGRESSYRIAIALMREGYRLRVFRHGFTIGDAKYSKGTFAAIRLRNHESLPQRIAELAEEHRGHPVAVAGPFTDEGVAFGDDARLAAIPHPSVAVVADWPVAQDHVFGGIRTILEADFGFAFSPVLLETVNKADLSKYTAVVLPHAGMSMRGGPNFSSGYRGILNLANLRRYVQGGGTLIAVKGAGAVVAADSVLGRGISVDGWAEHTNGAILRAKWSASPNTEKLTVWRPGLDDVGQPLLGAGFARNEFAAPGAYPVLFKTNQTSDRVQVVARYGTDRDQLVLDGYMLDSDRDLVAGRPFTIVLRVGRGRVIYFADSTTFRGNWYGLNLLFLNAIIMGPVL